ncbi:hypothetical protein [Neisseria sicca]|uniref:Uncharacterized protein n=1 Tax=Neisseria sicca VK64 TaxID=1095748 RepID=I2NSX1_NEISI|nr:hypothetical protein [Neisseria sicca]EIG28932.1 hypothetical protein HMPREF1051_1643 [Neisseria sicca VK64]
MEKSENVNIRQPSRPSLFWICFVLFVIPISCRFKSIYCSNISALIAIFIPSIFCILLPKFKTWLLKTIPKTETAKQLQEKAKKQEAKRIHNAEFNDALKNWSEYNLQVIFFSVVIFIAQNISIQKGNLDINDTNLFWLFVQICLYSTIFSRIKIKQIEEARLNDNQKDHIKKVNNYNYFLLFFSLLLTILGLSLPLLPSQICICYLNCLSYAMLLMTYCNQFKIELFHSALPVLNRKTHPCPNVPT